MSSQRVPEVLNTTTYPELGQTSRPQVPPRQAPGDYPLIDSDPHFSRVVRYARSSDYAHGAVAAAAFPLAFAWMDRMHPLHTDAKSFRNALRLTGGLGLFAGFFLFYGRSIYRFYGFRENRREIELDMREMTDKVKRGEPLYGVSGMTDYMQGAASRQSRYSGVFLHVMPWFNFVHHNHHGVDTAKYYQQAERELEAEKSGKGRS